MRNTGCFMNKLASLIFFVLFASAANAVNISELNGMWLIESYQELNGGKEVNADGTDYWEFNNTKHAAHSSGFRFDEVDFVLTNDIIVVNSPHGEKMIKIESFNGNVMQVNDGKFQYKLHKQ